MAPIIRKLTAADLEIWRKTRHEALQLHPEAFGSSYEEEKAQPDSHYLSWIESGAIFGAFNGKELVGIAGLFFGKTVKTRHRSTLYSVYIKRENRGSGISDKLIKAISDYAATCAMQIHCTVVTINVGARKLYERHGFTVYGTEPRAICVDGNFYDEHLMIKKLK